jgi:23S rRNA pseudouridine1911/1915/1917 synthase
MSTNCGHDYRVRVALDGAGRTLVAYLASRYRHSSPDVWRGRIADGEVRVDGRPARPEDVLLRGQLVVWSRPAWQEPDAPAGFAVLYEDEHLLGVAKPAGLPTLPGAGFLENTLLVRVRARDAHASPLHRLGRHTSGVVLFARTDRARIALSRQWAAREVGKRYRALACGTPVHDTFRVTERIGPVPHAFLGTVHGASHTGRDSTSAVTVIERRGDTFLCDVEIETGRPHQIRIHLAAAGHPLAGDPLYGPGGVPAPGCRALPGDPGYRLHAAELSFRHPASDRRLTIACAPPPELRHTRGT